MILPLTSEQLLAQLGSGASPATKLRLCRENADKWERLSTMFAREGLHREADDATTEAGALRDLAGQVAEEIAGR